MVVPTIARRAVFRIHSKENANANQHRSGTKWRTIWCSARETGTASAAVSSCATCSVTGNDRRPEATDAIRDHSIGSGRQIRLPRRETFSIGGNMQINDNSGKKIGRLDTSVSRDLVVTVHEIRNITTITARDRNTGKVKTETLIGESPFGK